MDATRTRRTKDRARQAWYASRRRRQFARFLGFGLQGTEPGPAKPARRPDRTGMGRSRPVGRSAIASRCSRPVRFDPTDPTDPTRRPVRPAAAEALAAIRGDGAALEGVIDELIRPAD